MSSVDSMKQDNGRCGTLEVVSMALVHVALNSTHHISTAHMSSYSISISVTENNHVIGIHKYTCSNYPCNMNNDPCDRNTKTINTCIPMNLCISDI